MRNVRLYFIFLGSLLGLAACDTHVAVNELQRADSLMASHADSALIILENIAPDELLTSYDRAEYALLLTQAQHKNYIALTSDSLILKAVNYFKDSKDDIRKAKSYFYLGCAYREMNKIVSATDAFLKALRSLPDERKDYKTFVMICDYLASCYEKQNFYDEALDMYKQSYRVRIAAKDSINAYYPLRGLAHIFLVKEKADSALFYYNKSLEIANKKKDSLWISTVYCDIARVYNKEKKYKDAYQLISKSLAYSPRSKNDLTITYFLKGDILYNLNQVDSARHYLKLSKKSNNLNISTASYDQLYQLEKAMGNSSAAIVYADSFITLYDSVYMLADYAEMDRLMDNHQLELHKQDLAAKEQSRNRLLWALFLLICLMGAFVFMYVDKQRKKRYIDLQKQMMKNRADALLLQEKMEQENVEGSVATKNKEQWICLKTEQFRICKELFRSSPYYTKLKAIEVSSDAKEIFLTAEEREALQKNLRQMFADVILELKTQCRELTQDDLLYCILILLGYSKSTICCCLAVSPNAFKMRKSRLKTKMGEELFSFISSCHTVGTTVP